MMTTFCLSLKGTVARDFWPQVFFANRPHIDSRFTLKIIFEFGLDFEQIFEKVLSSALSETARVKKSASKEKIFSFSVVLGLYLSHIYVFSKKYLFKIDSNPLIFKDLI
jgi:hypothetical protein